PRPLAWLVGHGFACRPGGGWHGSCQWLLEDGEARFSDDAGRLFVKLARTDPGDGRVLVSGARDVEQGGEEQGCAQPAIAMRGERTDGPEPAEAAVVAIVSGERSPFAVESARH